jgi:cell division protein FtsQ
LKLNFRNSVEVRRNRLKRNSGKIYREALSACALLAVVVAIASAMIFAYSYLLSTDLFRLDRIDVKGCERLTEKDVITAAQIGPAQNLLALRTSAVADRIKKNPWVGDIEVTRSFPHALSVSITEKKPVALVKRMSDLYFLDAEGSVIKKLESGEDTDLPVLTGFSENAELVRKSIELLNFFAAQAEFPQARDIAEINGDEVQGLSIFLDNGLCLQLGLDDYAGKLKKFKIILADLGRRNIGPGFLLIDLHNPGAITVQKRGVQPLEKDRQYKKYKT